MKKVKRFVAGFLAALGISGMLGGCKDKESSDFLVESDESYSLLNDNEKEEEIVIIDELLSNYDVFYLLLEELEKQDMGIRIECDLERLSIFDNGRGNINYDLLNQFLEVYSLIQENGKVVYYFNGEEGSEWLDFEKINIQSSQILRFAIFSYQEIVFENIEKAIEQNNHIELLILLSEDLPELPLNLLATLSGKDSKITIASLTEGYVEALSKIDSEWEFEELSLRVHGDYSKYLKNFSANHLSLDLYDSFFNQAFLSSSVETLHVYPLQEGLKVNFFLPDSLKEIWIKCYEKYEEVLLSGNNNCKLWLNSDNKDDLVQLAKSGCFDFSEMVLDVGDLYLQSYKGLIAVHVGGEFKGFLDVKKDSEGNIIGFDIADELDNEEALTRRRVK